jgi:hypothetical protein
MTSDWSKIGWVAKLENLQLDSLNPAKIDKMAGFGHVLYCSFQIYKDVV